MYRVRNKWFMGWLSLAAVVGCTGQIPGGLRQAGNGEDDSPLFDDDGLNGEDNPLNRPDAPDYRPPRFSCAEGSLTQALPLRRLTKLQVENTIVDSINRLAGQSAPDVLKVAKPLLEKWPEDRYTSVRDKGHDGFLRADHAASQQHADAHVALAIAVGKALTDTEAKRRTVVGDCATDANTSNDVACVDAFVRDKGSIILRGVMSEDDVTFYRKAMRGTVASAEALADVLGLLLASPRVFFHVEADDNNERLSPIELAGRLSYQLWDAPPDDELWVAATAGTLTQPDEYRSQVKRMLDSPRAREVTERFFNQWLTLHSTADLTRSLQFPNYERLVGADKPTQSATTGMVDDITGLVRRLYDSNEPMINFLTDRLVYTNDPYVLSVYGLNAGDKDDSPVDPPSEARVGLITRPAMLASGDYSTHPIIKGVRLRTHLLCEDLPPAPPDAMAQAAETVLPNTPISQRVETEIVTSPPGCAACHVAFNDLGFATENFDSLGRERDKELVIDKTGQVVAELEIDTAVNPNVDDLDDAMVDGAAGLQQSIVRSRKVESCFAAQFVRYSFGKAEEDAATDGCLLAALENRARNGASLKQLMMALVESDAFLARRVD